MRSKCIDYPEKCIQLVLALLKNVDQVATTSFAYLCYQTTEFCKRSYNESLVTSRFQKDVSNKCGRPLIFF